MATSRKDALELLHEHVEQESLRKHCLSVEAVMRQAARENNEDEERWGVTGLLHDFDYEKYPDEHPQKGSVILKERGFSDDIIRAILGHNPVTGVARDTLMAKYLFAVDELAGMVMATAYVRPTNLEGMSVKSVNKNMKKKGFAAAINREEIGQAIEELGKDKEEVIMLVIKSMQSISSELGF